MFVAFGQNVSCSASRHVCPVKDNGQFWQMSTILKKRYFVRSCWFYNSSWPYLISKEDNEEGSWNWENWWANSFAMRKAKTTPFFTITRFKPYTRYMCSEITKRITIPSISLLSTWEWHKEFLFSGFLWAKWSQRSTTLKVCVMMLLTLSTTYNSVPAQC